MKKPAIASLVFVLLVACAQPKTEYTSYADYPTTDAKMLWLEYNEDRTTFRLWSPTAEAVELRLYAQGDGGEPWAVEPLERKENGVWELGFNGDLKGAYYTFRVKINDEWSEETPGIYAQAVGVNGKRAMVVDLNQTNPEGWEADKGPELNKPNDAIIYELHIRDMTIHPNAGSSMPGKYLGLVEADTKGPQGVKTGIDHLKELGITHVHLLPTFDHYAIDETKLDSAQYNWGYDPQNYNVPEGSFSSDPFRAEVRIMEFKQMVKAFHDNGIGVILDVVYNHTGRTENSNFNLEAPGYYYRQREDSTYSDASGCGNETASEREMMRQFMIQSVTYWAREYHLDGFRFDLMGIHDIETMNALSKAVKEVNPNVIIYGEGWTAGDSPLPEAQRALKKHTYQMPQVSAFSDDIRDGIKGSVFDDASTGFVSGAAGAEESIKFGVVGSISYPGLDYATVNYSDTAWANAPWQAVNYVSCHDNHTLYDKLKISRPDATEEELERMARLANAIVLTSQGTAFLHAGAEMLRTKHGEHNSYNLPDSINRIDWNWKAQHSETVAFYAQLIALRKAHPAFRMTTQAQVVENLRFILPNQDEVVAYIISNSANGDSWKEIMVVYNARPEALELDLDPSWQIALFDDQFYPPIKSLRGPTIKIPALSSVIAYKE